LKKLTPFLPDWELDEGRALGEHRTMEVVERGMRAPPASRLPERTPSMAPFLALGVLFSYVISDVAQHSPEPDRLPARGWTLLLTTASVFVLAIVLTRVRSLVGSVLLTLCLAPVLTFALTEVRTGYVDPRHFQVMGVWYETSAWAAGPLAGLFLVRIPAVQEDRARLGSFIQELDTRAVWLAVLGVASVTALFVASLPLDPEGPPRSSTLAIALLGFGLSCWFAIRNGVDLVRLSLVGRRLRGMSCVSPDSPATSTIDLGVGNDVFAAKPVGSAYRAAIASERVLGDYPEAKRIAMRHLAVSALVTVGVGVGLAASMSNLLPRQLIENVPLLSDHLAETR
jgi:hypothetical protein